MSPLIIARIDRDVRSIIQRRQTTRIILAKYICILSQVLTASITHWNFVMDFALYYGYSPKTFIDRFWYNERLACWSANTFRCLKTAPRYNEYAILESCVCANLRFFYLFLCLSFMLRQHAKIMTERCCLGDTIISKLWERQATVEI